MPRLSSFLKRRSLLRARLAMPAALVGLVAFSFTLLALGTSVYTAVLPSMLAEAQDGAASDGEGASAGASNADGAQPTGESGKQGSAANGASTAEVAGATKASKAAAATTAKTSGASKDQGGDNQDAASDSGKGASAGNASSGSNSGTADPAPAPNPGPSTEDQELDRQLREFLVSKANLAGDYASRVSAQMTAFDASADAATCLAAANECDVLSTNLASEWAAVMNSTLGSSLGTYDQSRGTVIGMYRCLSSAMDALAYAWRASAVAEPDYDDINATIDIANGYVDDYNAYVGQLAL